MNKNELAYWFAKKVDKEVNLRELGGLSEMANDREAFVSGVAEKIAEFRRLRVVRARGAK